MYGKYFGFQEMPFSIAPDPRYLYMSEQHREALAHLLYGFNSDGGFVLLTGEVGTGKTTVCRCLLEQIPEDSAIAFILNPKLTVEELLETICDEFSIDHSSSRKTIKGYVDLITSFLFSAYAKGRKTVLIIDEAQNLSPDVLEELRLLTNLETNQRKLLQIMLIGQPELKAKLSRPDLRQLSQRIIARYHLGPLSKKDVQAYITHRLSIAGVQKEVFSSPVIQKIYDMSGGVPRLINLICDRALLGTYVEGGERVSMKMLKKAAVEIFGGRGDSRRSEGAHKWILISSVIAIAALIFAVTLDNHEPEYIPKKTAKEDITSSTAETPLTDSLIRKEGLDKRPGYRDGERALQELLGLWGYTYTIQDKTPLCRQVEEKGLRCLYARGSLRSLLRLDRPAVLKLINDDGEVWYATLSSIEDSSVTILFGGRLVSIAKSEIERQWLGNYTLFWKTPPSYNGYIKLGDSGPDVVWLNSQLRRIQSKASDPVYKDIFDEELLDMVKEFQRTFGLIPDGIAGERTLIRINSITDAAIPTLTQREKS